MFPSSLVFAEAEGFEPPVPRGTTVFKTAAFDHSATPLGLCSFPPPEAEKSERKISRSWEIAKQTVNEL